MTEEERFQEVEELARENNRILRKLLVHQRLGMIITVFKWAIIIGAALGTYYFLQPYIESILEVYSGFNNLDISSFLNGNTTTQ